MDSHSYTGPVPSGAVGAWVVIALYSLICFVCSIVLFIMNHNHSERWSYVSLLALSISCSTLASIIQQIYTAIHFEQVQLVAWQQAKLSLVKPALALGPLSTGFPLALYWIQYYCYVVDAILVLFWAIVLVKGVYNIRIGKRMSLYQRDIGVISKIFACTVPALFVGCFFIPALERNAVAGLIINAAPMLVCFLLGSFCVVAIVFKYVKSRQLFVSLQDSKSLPTTTNASQAGRTRHAVPRAARIGVDKWLLLRFSIAFVILSAFEVSVIIFEWSRYKNANQLADKAHPDVSTSTGVSSVMGFIPGVTAGLLVWLLFGTTPPFRRVYAENFRALFPRPSRRPSFERTESESQIWRTLPTMPSTGVTPLSYKVTVRGGQDVDSINLAPLGIDSKQVSKVVSVVQDAEEYDDDKHMQTETRRMSGLPHWRTRD